MNQWHNKRSFLDVASASKQYERILLSEFRRFRYKILVKQFTTCAEDTRQPHNNPTRPAAEVIRPPPIASGRPGKPISSTSDSNFTEMKQLHFLPEIR